ncbi:hypothetical protein Bhyg_14400, partial [Pseudolycoriella hygida]
MKVVLMLVVAIAAVQVALSKPQTGDIVNTVTNLVGLGFDKECIPRCPLIVSNSLICMGPNSCPPLKISFAQNVSGRFIFPC